MQEATWQLGLYLFFLKQFLGKKIGIIFLLKKIKI